MVTLIFLFFVLFIVCCSCEDDDQGEEADLQAVGPTANILPPLFYTENLTDPLMQVDLKERILTN